MVAVDEHNVPDLQQELNWLRQVLKTRSELNKNNEAGELLPLTPPDLTHSNSRFALLVKKHKLNAQDRFLLILAATPFLQPALLDIFLVKDPQTQRYYTQFGGRRGTHHNGFIPTLETVLFILAGNDFSQRMQVLEKLNAHNVLFRENLLQIGEVHRDEPYTSGTLSVSRECLDEISLGKVSRPVFGSAFPARQLSTDMGWDGLVLNSATLGQLEEIETWLQYGHRLMHEWGMAGRLKPGYRALFYGPPGTGKTLTANLLGKKTGLDVYRIDLSQLISKFIGETEKNLAKIFDRAENRNWILFFDEADAIFGKRTSVNDAHDRYANQEVSYLLQRVEEYSGLIILASNLKNNIDEAFMRRFQSTVHFPMPRAGERQILWQKGFPDQIALEERIDLHALAQEYELSGGSIMNVVQYSVLMALKGEKEVINLADVLEGIRREFHKSGRTI